MKKKLTKKYFIYILRCADDSLYTGYTTDLNKRVDEHNGIDKTATVKSIGAKYTRGRQPVVLVHSESFKTRSEAMQREYAIKKLKRPEKEKLIND